MTRYIDLNRGSYGVEPICAELQIAPSSYYAARSRPPSARDVNDTMLKDVIIRVHRANFGVYGARKVWKALHRLGMDAGRDQVARLMKAVALQGVTREKTIRTTRPDDQAARPADLVERSFTASRAQSALARRSHLRMDRRRLRLHRLHHRRLLPTHRRLADVDESADRSRARRPRDGARLPGQGAARARSTIPIAGFNTWPFATPSAWMRPRLSTASGARGIQL